jgi:hypothetical protein
VQEEVSARGDSATGMAGDNTKAEANVSTEAHDTDAAVAQV